MSVDHTVLFILTTALPACHKMTSSTHAPKYFIYNDSIPDPTLKITKQMSEHTHLSPILAGMMAAVQVKAYNSQTGGSTALFAVSSPRELPC